jgi:UDP-glucose 4-epimerase
VANETYRIHPTELDGSGVKVLITGGAGYIGSTVGSACLDAGITPVILDSLVTGRREFTSGREFYEGDIADGALLDKVFAEHPDIEAIVHCAALIVVPDSVSDPVRYYEWNVTKSLEMLRHLLRNRCHRLLFSSSAAIYQASDGGSVDEDSPIVPLSPYGRTKAVCEGMFADVAAGTPLRVLSLRYFNPIGADPELRTGQQVRLPSHALGQLIQAHDSGQAFRITGTDYPTRDGSGIRDYVHVWDLAAAHVAALRSFDAALDGAPSLAINLGTGAGTTVRELVAAFNSVVTLPVKVVEAPRRPGDPAGAFTRTDRARRLLGWSATHTLAEGIADSLRWAEIRDSVLAEAR